MNTRSPSLLRAMAAFVTWAAVFFPFAYYSDFVPPSQKRFGHEPPQFEAEVLADVLFLLSPFSAAFYVMLVVALRAVLRCFHVSMEGVLRIRNGWVALLFVASASLLVAAFLALYVPYASCCPGWQCRILAPGYGLATHASLTVSCWHGLASIRFR